MRARTAAVRLPGLLRLIPILALVAATGGCTWRLFESIRITGAPVIVAPGGTVRQRISDLDVLAELEAQLAAAFESGTRVASRPYTFRGSIAPLSVDVDEFFADAGVNEQFEIGPIILTEFDPGEVVIGAVNAEIPLIDGVGSWAPDPFEAPVPALDGFVEATIGEGTMSLAIGDEDTAPLPAGTYTLTVVAAGAENPADNPTFGPQEYIDPLAISAEVDLAGLLILNNPPDPPPPVLVTITLEWDVADPATDIPVSVSFALVELAELVIDIGADPLGAIAIDPIEIPEDLRRQVESVGIDGDESWIRFLVTANLPTGVAIRLLSDALFEGGDSNEESILAGTPGVQELLFPITAGEVYFGDPDTDETEWGPGEIGQLAVDVDAVLDGYDVGTGHLTLTGIRTDAPLGATLSLTAEVAVQASSVTLRDVGSLLDDYAFALEGEDLEALGALPEWLRFVSIPVRIAVDGTVDPADAPSVDLAVTAFRGGELVGAVVFPPVTIGAGPAEANVAPLLNGRPDTIEFDASSSGDGRLRLERGDFLRVVVEVDIVFQFQVVPASGDEANLLAAFFDDGSFTMEGDALGRESAEDLVDLLDTVGNARLDIDFVRNTTGLDGLRFEIVEESPGGDWVVAGGYVGSGLTNVELTSADITRIRDTYPFTPAFRIFIPRRDGTGSYALDYDGEIEATVRLELAADIDYTFHLFGGSDS